MPDWDLQRLWRWPSVCYFQSMTRRALGVAAYPALAFMVFFARPAGAETAACMTTHGQAIVLPAAACTGGKLLAEQIYEKLLPVLGLTQANLPFSIDLKNEEIDSYHLFHTRVSVSKGLMERFGTNAAVLVYVLAHELGHAAQFQTVDWPTLKKTFTQEQIESHADLIGGQIVVRAGYPIETYLAGEANFFNRQTVDAWLRPWTWRDSRGDHPYDSIRRWNMENFERRIVELDRSPQDGFHPVIGADAFTIDGRLKPNALPR